MAVAGILSGSRDPFFSKKQNVKGFPGSLDVGESDRSSGFEIGRTM